MRSLRSSFQVIGCVTVVQLCLILHNPMASAQEVIDFRVTDFARFTCEAKGFRCAYIKEDYADFKLSEGSQDSIGAIDGQGNNVWSNVGGVDNSLTLQDCQADYCLVRCNFGCHCFLENGEEDCEPGTAPPDNQEPTSPPEVCPQTINAEVCPLLLDAIPSGNINNYDCFNFCNGTFISSCDFGGSCADYDCGVDRASTDGMLNGIVVGCSKAALQGQGSISSDGGSGSTSGSASSDGVASWGKFSAFALVSVVAGWWFALIA